MAKKPPTPENPGENAMVVVYLEGEIVVHEACTIDSREENSICLHGGSVHVLPRKDRKPDEIPVFLGGLPSGKRQGPMASHLISYSGVPFVVMERGDRLKVMSDRASRV